MLVAMLVWLELAGSLPAAETPPTFEKDVAPILHARCGKCHGDGKFEGGLDLRRKSRIVQGGDSGTALVAGQPDKSLLWQKIEQGEMPPKGEARLDESQRGILRRWIAAGAPLANAEEPPLDETGPRVAAADRQFWSFRTPVRPALPNVAAADRVRTPVDAFLAAKLEEKGLAFNPDAAKPTLLRRVCFDLLGRPPTPEQLDAFLADDAADAYERLVERLLISPAYGERWGRHWLDIAGYADSDGYLAADRLRPEAWRYRDYVIQALNRDLPYDRFVTEQLAGDELSDWRRADELTPEMARQLTATGFLRTASDPTYPGYIEPNEVHQVLSDTMQIVGSTFFGLTLQCARCHSHKYDPLSQRDYYAVLSVLLPAYDPARWQPSEVRGIRLASEAEAVRIAEHNKKVDERLQSLSASLLDVTLRYRRRFLAETLAERGTAIDRSTIDKLTAAVSQPAAKRSDEQKSLIAQYLPQEIPAEPETRFAEFKEEADKLKAAIAAETALKRPLPLVRGLADLDEKPPVGRILQRGDYNKPGAEVAAGVPAVLATDEFRFVAQPGYKTTGQRLAFARWLTDPAHPLLARVQVNRLWAHHFGRGIVPTVANFGRSGARPSHPELLDWLATELIRDGWSLKSLHRTILNSTVYRQTADVSPAKSRLDPENVLLGAWPTRRVEGEVVRDSLLAVAGKLNERMYGAPAPVAPQGDGSVLTADDAQGNRRSIYLIVRRSQHLTLFDLFDTPLMEVNCPQRSVSTVPLQSLAMLHGPLSERIAAAFAERILRESPPDDDQRMDVAFRLAFGRLPSERERGLIRGFLKSDVRDAWTQIALVLLNSNEFVYVN